MTTVPSLEEFLARIPESARPWAAKYFPLFAGMALEQLCAIRDLLAAGDVEAPYRAALAAMTPEQLDAETAQFTLADGQHAQANADAVAARREAAWKGAGLILTLLLGLVA
jgi:hypothetical protein